jgi:hypothetical protein
MGMTTAATTRISSMAATSTKNVTESGLFASFSQSQGYTSAKSSFDRSLSLDTTTSTSTPDINKLNYPHPEGFSLLAFIPFAIGISLVNSLIWFRENNVPIVQHLYGPWICFIIGLLTMYLFMRMVQHRYR